MLNNYMKYAFEEIDKNQQEEVQVKKLCKEARMPLQGSDGAAGYDLYSTEEAVLSAGETKLIPTGLAIAFPRGTFGAIYARSGLAIKRGLRPANCVGIIDEDYRGEIAVALRNDSDETQTIHIGDRIAQLVVQRYETVNMVWVNELDETKRGEGGFGSTGSN